jgi:hypothetical protein
MVLLGIEAVINTFPMVIGNIPETETLAIIEQSKRISQNDGISTPNNFRERISSGSVQTIDLSSPTPPSRYSSFSFCKTNPDSGSELQSWAEKKSVKLISLPSLSKFANDAHGLGLSSNSGPARNNQKFNGCIVKDHVLKIQELEARNLKSEAKILQLIQQINTQQMIPEMSETSNPQSQNTKWERSQTLEYSNISSGIASAVRSPQLIKLQRPSIDSGKIAHLLSSNNSAVNSPFPNTERSRAPLNPSTLSEIDFLSENNSKQLSRPEIGRNFIPDLLMGPGHRDFRPRTN